MVAMLAGAVLVVLGLFSGVVLVAAPLGLAAWSPNLAVWVLFPLLTLVGYMLTVAGSRTSQIQGLSFGLSCALLVLAVLAAAALVLSAAAVLPLPGSTLSLWYVLAIAGSLGSIGAASRGSVSRTS
ncbi:MAG TPA: hypothetical protein VHM00_16965 [Caldimonas sp.]|jgi:cytochrome bd-type quinol oxidase subunit 2|nr:hypothetical protein [Caldimonas sp.]HEX2542763.1 hypothetical protein [Caldimonas sp.]